MEYRRAGGGDISTLVEMRIEMLCEESMLTDSFQLEIRNETALYLENGFADGSVAGWVSIEHQKSIAMGCIGFFMFPPNDRCASGKTAYVGNLYVAPAYRKKGIARSILSHLLDEARGRHCERVLLNTTEMGKSLYEKMGFSDSPTAMALYPFGNKRASKGPGIAHPSRR